MQNKNTYEKLEYMLDTSQISICVKDQHLDQVGGFVTYLLLGNDKLGTFQMRRRFNDFFFLRQALVKKWPGCYIPPIPSKKMAGNKEEKFIQDRRRFLQYFLVKVAGLKYIYYCEIFQQFLRNKSAVMQNISLSVSKCTANQIAVIYKQIFSNFNQKENIGDLRTKINNFNVYLKKSQKQLELLKAQIRQVAFVQRTFNDNMNICNELIFPEYQKNVFSEYVNQQANNLIYLNDNQVNQRIRQLKVYTVNNPIDYLVDLIAFELREVQALQEAISTKELYEQKKRRLEEKKKDQQSQLSKLMSGKTTFKSIFSKGNKSQQIGKYEKSILQDQKQIQSLGILLDYINIILGLVQINKFKAYKQTQYVDTLSKISKSQLAYLGIYGGLMKALVIANQNIKYE